MRKIMIVEDDPAIREELALLLENEGYQALAVTDFGDVPGQAGTFGPDLVLLDLGLPGRDGFSLCAELRRRCPVPIVVVTSRNSAADELRALSLGGDDYITKPYSIPILLARIKAVLRRSGGPSEPDILEAWGSAAQPVQGDRVGKWTDRGAHTERAEDPGPPDGPRRGDRVPGRPDRGAVGQQDLYR